MDLLVLGGTHHVGRCIVEEAVARGWLVTMVNRGTSGHRTPGTELLIADRLAPGQLEEVLGDGKWDAVVDTWSAAPAPVRDAAQLLAGRARHFGYVSSRSVYEWPIAAGLDETGPVVAGDPSSTESGDYASAKRGGELAALEAFGDRALVARAGLILGPYELIGRLPWWLRRLERGGPVLCPGPPGRALQYIDGRDLASWMLDMAAAGRGGVFDTVSRAGHTTMGALLETANRVTGGRAELVWVTPDLVEAQGISPWTELPIWLPPEGEAAGLHAGNTNKVHKAGMVCRPIADTVESTWRWLETEGDPPSLEEGRVGYSAAREQAALLAAGQ
ncbi:MAG TPA: NAD-dependent epimerase/dehydratase family protein [Acidimicrobiales bacterium]|jgi:nucleoside-diphosphate-sugar epimerase|nr:NAD-dependent epimerase/dehydratase family protein [Acidimicrobiales bacterium]